MNLSYPIAREVHGIHYCLLAPLDPGQARFTFTGKFQHQESVWDATLFTLAHFYREHRLPIPPNTCSAFLVIGSETRHGRALRVVLDIPLIDEPVILRTIIMIRNYKRLQSGRHEFGETRSAI
jgi:hypothetical protein